ncbi:pyruvate,orthophosphate dikinase [Methanolinea mesophila]|uniref:PEP/pyruvate-binding domain-containing protein n=1 Tax=Methanolinea mesophila TaxID=547055 RepID=UPI001AE8C630|nr:PEP/pyruvate-binding domain-containing protein [Methanolinea mesophila]MBP1929319.1 pyruvate,orthophosphate dikinase [Methanolinea mesophila]
MIRFGPGTVDEEITAEYFGNKAAGLAELVRLGIPVPPGFALSVVLCEEYFAGGGKAPDDLRELLREGISFLERATLRKFGGARNPLLVSVRSGAAASMPGVMETLLNVGLSRETVRGLIFLTGNPRFAWDTYRRALQNFGQAIYGLDGGWFHARLLEAMAAEDIRDEVELDAHSLKQLCDEYEKEFSTAGVNFPQDVMVQLELSALGVLRSWEGPRARAFRKMNLVEGARGTAVTVQAMVYGNLGSQSGAGVAFTRNPWKGDNELVIDFKFGAQGEDVVSGDQAATTQDEFRAAMPGVYDQLSGFGRMLELHFHDMQDIEFTVQDGDLFILQTRIGKRSPYAALAIAVNMVMEGILTSSDALWMLRDVDIDRISVQKISSRDYPVAIGVPASSGVASGMIALSSERAARDAEEGKDVILVSETASPDDLPGIHFARGLLTSRGARTSHAAVVARQLGKICVVNCTTLEIDLPRHRCTIGGQELREGEVITIDGNTGRVYLGEVEVILEKPQDLIDTVHSWENTG